MFRHEVGFEAERWHGLGLEDEREVGGRRQVDELGVRALLLAQRDVLGAERQEDILNTIFCDANLINFYKQLKNARIIIRCMMYLHVQHTTLVLIN